MVEGVKMRGFIAAFAIAAAVLTGCAPAASFNGSVAGHTLAVADSVFLAIRARDSTDAIGATIIVSDNTGLCETVRTGVLPKPTTVVFFTLLTVGKDLYTTTEPLTTGEFPFNPSSPGRTLFGEFHKYSEDCTHEAFALMSGGAATLSAFNATAGGSLVGNFEVVYSSGWGPNGQVSTDTVSGNLNARFCELDPARTPGGQFRCE